MANQLNVLTWDNSTNKRYQFTPFCYLCCVNWDNSTNNLKQKVSIHYILFVLCNLGQLYKRKVSIHYILFVLCKLGQLYKRNVSIHCILLFVLCKLGLIYCWVMSSDSRSTLQMKDIIHVVQIRFDILLCCVKQFLMKFKMWEYIIIMLVYASTKLSLIGLWSDS
jgi:hypothetical protein